MTDLFDRIEEIAGVAARQNEMLSHHTTFGVGGPCDLMAWVSTREALLEVLTVAKAENMPAFVLGKGSNLLVKDGGIDGIVIRLAGELAGVEIAGNQVKAGGGASLAELVSRATSAGIGGLEFLAGIPGSVGGAACANAGARDVWFGHRLLELAVVRGDLEDVRLTPEDVGFGYRTSGIAPDWVVTEAVLTGRAATIDQARHEVETYLARRRDSQPINERSAGCIFRNPSGHSAGHLIDKAGLKGLRVGGAEVSPVHANFIVNTGGATAREILELAAEVRRRVKDAYGVQLAFEISIVGKD